MNVVVFLEFFSGEYSRRQSGAGRCLYQATHSMVAKVTSLTPARVGVREGVKPARRPLHGRGHGPVRAVERMAIPSVAKIAGGVARARHDCDGNVVLGWTRPRRQFPALP